MIDRLSDGERRWLLALRGAYRPGAGAAEVSARLSRLIADEPDWLLRAAQHEPRSLDRLWRAVAGADARYPGRSAALLTIARALGRRLPESEYRLPEEALEALLTRARSLSGTRLALRGAAGHKGRVGDAVERLLLGAGKRARGRAADHPAAEIKSVPVSGDRVIERVKLGVVSPRSNPLEKCDRILFVFVEQRGQSATDHFVRGHHLAEFDRARWLALWQDGFLVETAAGSTRHPARGLYLTPAWFRAQRIWPQL